MRAVLDELVAEGRQHVRRTRGVRAVQDSLRSALLALLAVPSAVLLYQGLQVLAGATPVAVNPWWLLVAMVVAPVVVLALAWRRATALPVSRTEALALYDDAVSARERLVGADALLTDESGSGFVAAAIEDAGRYIGRARTVVLEAPAARPPQDRAAVGTALAAALVCALVLWVGQPAVDADAADDGEAETIETAARDAARTPQDPEPPSETPTAEPVATPDRKAGPVEPEQRMESSADQLPQQEKKKEGRTGTGRPSQAEPSQSAGDAKGSPTSQGQQTKKPQRQRKMKPAKKKKPSESQPQPEAKKTEGEESGSTSGRGSSKGSNKNPVTSDWTSKDQVTTEEDEDVEDDDEVEDEDVDSEARGGVQPSLRDRKPPVSRDLSIGFGNQPNPDANGRGGPSQPKKSRGTASLVLGVPIPDRVKGRANPGKTKVTQERIEPRPEGSAPIPGEARTPRSGPTGGLLQPELPPWMRDLIRDYFLRLRNQPKDTTK